MVYLLIQDFQHTTSDGQILTLKKGTKIDRKDGDDYVINVFSKEYRIKSVIVENNPTFFEKTDLKAQLQALLKSNSKRTTPKLAEILADFFEHTYIGKNKQVVDIDILETALDACRLQFIETKEDKFLRPIEKLGWDVDSKGVFKK